MFSKSKLQIPVFVSCPVEDRRIADFEDRTNVFRRAVVSNRFEFVYNYVDSIDVDDAIDRGVQTIES